MTATGAAVLLFDTRSPGKGYMLSISFWDAGLRKDVQAMQGYYRTPTHFKLRAAHGTPTGVLETRKYIVVTAAGRAEVLDDGQRWIPGTPLQEGRKANALLALARNAEAAELHEREQALKARAA